MDYPVSVVDSEDHVDHTDWERGVEDHLRTCVDIYSREDRRNIRVYFACRQIVARTTMLQVLYFNRFGDFSSKETPALNEEDFKRLSKRVFEAIEIPQSIGYNYLNTDNYERVLKQLEKADLVSAIFSQPRAICICRRLARSSLQHRGISHDTVDQATKTNFSSSDHQ